MDRRLVAALVIVAILVVGAALVFLGGILPRTEAGWRVIEGPHPGSEARLVHQTAGGELDLTFEATQQAGGSGYEGLYGSPIVVNTTVRLTFFAQGDMRAEVILREGPQHTAIECTPGSEGTRRSLDGHDVRIEPVEGGCAIEFHAARTLLGAHGISLSWALAPEGPAALGDVAVLVQHEVPR